MKTDKFHFFSLLAIFTLFQYFVGGYYAFYCAFGAILLAVLLLINVFRTKKLTVSLSLSAAVLALFAVSYLVTKFWAVDKSMSLYGFSKFMVPILFALNLWQVDSEDRPKILYSLPASATLMTVIGLLLGQLDRLHSVFFDKAGDFHGLFEYANGFAIYLLIAVIISVLKPKKNAKIIALDSVCAAVCAAGIYLTKSKAVFALSAATIVMIAFVFVLRMQKTRKKKTVFICAVAGLGVIALIVLAATGILSKLFTYVMTYGTVVERQIYWKDAFLYALHHPFGKGEYAFYYVQPEIQSASYYAIDVHNDFIQMCVEIGFIPTIAFVVMLVKSFVSRKTDVLSKFVLAAISLHAFFDFDLQFMSVFLILVLCLEFEREKTFEIQNKFFPSMICIALVVFNVIMGLSGYFNHTGRQVKSLYYYKNTSALLIVLQNTNEQQAAYELATDLLEINDNVFEANYTLSRVYEANDRYDEAIEQMELVLKKSPRDMDNYENYIDLCQKASEYYSKTGDSEKQTECLKKIASVSDRLSQLEKNTDEKAKKYMARQKFKVDEEHQTLIKQAKENLK